MAQLPSRTGANCQSPCVVPGCSWIGDWMEAGGLHWRNRIVPLERCEAGPRVIVEHPVPARATPERSAAEKARAKQRFFDNRRRLSEAYARLPHRPIWQAMKDSPLPGVNFSALSKLSLVTAFYEKFRATIASERLSAACWMHSTPFLGSTANP